MSAAASYAQRAIDNERVIVQLERANGVLVVRGHKDDERQRRGIDAGDDVETAFLRHLNVEEQNVGVHRTEQRLGLLPGRGLPHNREVRLGGQKRAQSLPRHRLVVCDQYAHGFMIA